MARSGKIIHRTNRGRVFDLEAAQIANANQRALGNARMNTMGDILDERGNVIKRRDQIVQEYYSNNPNSVKKVSLSPTSDSVFETPEQAIARLRNKSAETATEIPDAPVNVAGKRQGRKMVDPDSKDND